MQRSFILGLFIVGLHIGGLQAEPVQKFSLDAREKLAVLKNPTDEQIKAIRRDSELTVAELLAEPGLESLSTRARHSRPAATPNEALYIDFYQESPVLIDYEGHGNVVKKMSFGVVYKYLRDESGAVVPHFVRAQLVSSGKEGHRTPTGTFDIDSRHRYYVSHEYDSEMDYAQFFIGGVALHQTPDANYSVLGGPASHGCVRHHELDADAMWNLVGNALDDDHMVNVKVYPFNVDVTLADGNSATDYKGMGADVTDWLNKNIACTRRGETAQCTNTWVKW